MITRLAAAILRDLGVRSIRLLTSSPRKVEGLQAAGIPLAGTHPLAVDPGANVRLTRPSHPLRVYVGNRSVRAGPDVGISRRPGTDGSGPMRGHS